MLENKSRNMGNRNSELILRLKDANIKIDKLTLESRKSEIIITRLNNIITLNNTNIHNLKNEVEKLKTEKLNPLDNFLKTNPYSDLLNKTKYGKLF